MVYFARIFCTRKGAGFQRLGFRAEFLQTVWKRLLMANGLVELRCEETPLAR
jgi:hypothetical protein